MSPLTIVQFRLQQNGAKRRGIAWEFTFEEWLEVWESSGHAEHRGRCKGQYVMGRHGDVGPYSRSNVSIIPFEQNCADAHVNGRHVRTATPFDYDFASPPAPVELSKVLACQSYREAVRAAWEARVIQRMTRRTLAELIGAYPSHATDYMCEDDAPKRRDLPARLIPEFEWVVGNTIVTQWLSLGARQAVLEEMQLLRATA